MSYLELDDGILDHPKFVLAADRGGSGAIHMWLGLRAYCGQHVTDGDIPKYMLKKVSGPERPRDREHALAVLIEVRLVEDRTDHYQLHDFLDHCRSRDEIITARARNRERQAKSRGSHTVTDAVTARVVTPAVTLPSPLLSPPLRKRRSDPPPPSVGPPLRVEPDISTGDLASFAPEPAKVRAKKPKKTLSGYPEGLAPLERQREKCAELRLDCAREFERFSAHHQAKGSVFADWQRAFDTWIGNAPGFQRGNQRVPQPKQPNGGTWKPNIERAE